MKTLPLSVTPEERAEHRRKRGEKKREVKYLADTMKVTVHDIEYALEKFKGNVTKAATFLGTESHILRRKIQSTPGLIATMNKVREEKVDDAEFKLAEQVEQGYFPAIALTLKTLGQNRGYTERTVTEHELSRTAVKDAASLIEAMKRGMSLIEDKPPVLELEEIAWHTVEELPAPPS